MFLCTAGGVKHDAPMNNVSWYFLAFGLLLGWVSYPAVAWIGKWLDEVGTRVAKALADGPW